MSCGSAAQQSVGYVTRRWDLAGIRYKVPPRPQRGSQPALSMHGRWRRLLKGDWAGVRNPRLKLLAPQALCMDYADATVDPISEPITIGNPESQQYQTADAWGFLAGLVASVAVPESKTTIAEDGARLSNGSARPLRAAKTASFPVPGS